MILIIKDKVSLALVRCQVICNRGESSKMKLTLLVAEIISIFCAV